jgi:hypothetical protein
VRDHDDGDFAILHETVTLAVAAHPVCKLRTRDLNGASMSSTLGCTADQAKRTTGANFGLIEFRSFWVWVRIS